MHSIFKPWGCLWFVAPATIRQAKHMFWTIRSRSVTAWLPQASVHHWKGNMVTLHIGFLKPHFILDLWMIVLIHFSVWNFVCRRINVVNNILLHQWGLCCSWGLYFGTWKKIYLLTSERSYIVSPSTNVCKLHRVKPPSEKDFSTIFVDKVFPRSRRSEVSSWEL